MLTGMSAAGIKKKVNINVVEYAGMLLGLVVDLAFLYILFIYLFITLQLIWSLGIRGNFDGTELQWC